MLIDCSTCAAKPAACADCVVTVLLGLPGAEPELDPTERRAIDALADGGLIPPLRLVPIGPPRGLPDPSRRASETGTGTAERGTEAV